MSVPCINENVTLQNFEWFTEILRSENQEIMSKGRIKCSLGSQSDDLW